MYDDLLFNTITGTLSSSGLFTGRFIYRSVIYILVYVSNLRRGILQHTSDKVIQW